MRQSQEAKHSAANMRLLPSCRGGARCHLSFLDILFGSLSRSTAPARVEQHRGVGLAAGFVSRVFCIAGMRSWTRAVRGVPGRARLGACGTHATQSAADIVATQTIHDMLRSGARRRVRAQRARWPGTRGRSSYIWRSASSGKQASSAERLISPELMEEEIIQEQGVVIDVWKLQGHAICGHSSRHAAMRTD